MIPWKTSTIATVLITGFEVSKTPFDTSHDEKKIS